MIYSEFHNAFVMAAQRVQAQVVFDSFDGSGKHMDVSQNVYTIMKIIIMSIYTSLSPKPILCIKTVFQVVYPLDIMGLDILRTYQTC